MACSGHSLILACIFELQVCDTVSEIAAGILESGGWPVSRSPPPYQAPHMDCTVHHCTLFSTSDFLGSHRVQNLLIPLPGESERLGFRECFFRQGKSLKACVYSLSLHPSGRRFLGSIAAMVSSYPLERRACPEESGLLLLPRLASGCAPPPWHTVLFRISMISNNAPLDKPPLHALPRLMLQSLKATLWA